MTTLKQKLQISSGSALLFAVINLQITYKLTDSIFPMRLYNKITDCPTNAGRIVHTLLFFVLTYLSMYSAKIKRTIKLKHTIYATLLFYLLSSPVIYSVSGYLLGSKFSNLRGCQNISGVILHSFIYLILLVLLMYLPDSK